jgi:hypothetical protein
LQHQSAGEQSARRLRAPLRFSTPEHVRGRANSHPRDCAEVDRVCLAASPSVDASDDAVDEAERSPACQPE